MEFKEYRTQTHQFAFYPEERALEYLSLGLIGEMAELGIEMKISCLGIEDNPNLLDEYGDCFWYLSELFNLLDISSESRTNRSDNRLLVLMSVKNLANIVKKHIRKTPVPNQEEKLIAVISYTYNFLISNLKEEELQYILDNNIKKLQERHTK